jgi:hypothetical protein
MLKQWREHGIADVATYLNLRFVPDSPAPAFADGLFGKSTRHPAQGGM